MLAVPKRPVSEIDGKYSARAAPISAFAAIRSLLGLRRGPRLREQPEGRPAGTTGIEIVELAVARDRPRIAPEQDRAHLPAARSATRSGGIVASEASYSDWLCASSICDLAVLEAQREDFHRIGAALGRGLRDVELAVERHQRDIRRRHRTSRARGCSRGALFACEQVRARGLGLAADLAEDDRFPTPPKASRRNWLEHRADAEAGSAVGADRHALALGVEAGADPAGTSCEPRCGPGTGRGTVRRARLRSSRPCSRRARW